MYSSMYARNSVIILMPLFKLKAKNFQRGTVRLSINDG